MEEVEYRLILHDELSKALQGASTNADHLESSMGHLRETIVRAAEAFALFEVGKESLNAYEEASKANAQLEASLKSTGHAAGLSTEELKKQGEELKNTSLYVDALQTKMQSVLLTFTNIKGDTFKEASQAIDDMTAKLGGDLQSTAIQVGKALQDPIHGITALHRVGVNFSEAQKLLIKRLVETGQAAKAQQVILKELEVEFGGSALASMNAAPLENIKKEWEETLEYIGGALMKIVIEIEPYVKMLFHAIKDVIDFLSNHTEAIKFFGTIMLGVGAAMAWTSLQAAFVATNFGVVAVNMGIATAAEYALETAQLALNAAMTANPIGIVIVAIAMLTAGIMDLINNYDKLEAEYDKDIHNRQRRAIEDETETVNKLAEAYEKQGMSKRKAQERALSIEKTNVDAEINSLNSNYSSAKTDQEKQFLAEQLVKSTGKKSALINPKVFEKQNAKNGLGIASTKPSEKVSGTNHTIINVNIQKLVETLKIESRTIKDGATMGAEHVTRALIASVNQFQASIDT